MYKNFWLNRATLFLFSQLIFFSAPNLLANEQGLDQEAEIRQSLEKIKISNFTENYNEFMSAVSAYHVVKAKKNPRKTVSIKKPDIAEQLRMNVLYRGIDLVKKLTARGHALAGDAHRVEEYQSVHRILNELYKTQSITDLKGDFFIQIKNASEKITENNLSSTNTPQEQNRVLPPNMQIEASNSARFKSRIWRMAAGTTKGLTHLSSSYSAFLIATGLITFVELGFNYEKNPVALDQYLSQGSDPLGAVSFGAMIAASGFTARQLQKIKSGILPKAFIPQIAMATGMIIGSLFHELLVDIDLRKCIRSGFKQDDVCDTAFDRWVVSNKIAQYAPIIISFSTSAIVSGYLTLGVSRGTSIFTGLWVGSKAEAVKKFGRTVLKGRYVASVGSFFVFILIDHAIAPHVSNTFDYVRIRKIDFKSWLDKKIFHRDYWRENAEEPIFYIQNVYDVEGTNIPSIQNYYDQLLEVLEINNWTSVGANYDLVNCYSKGLTRSLNELSMTAEQIVNFQKEFIASGNKIRKDKEMIDCEVISQPGVLLNRFISVQKDWRSYMLKDFYASLLNWMEWMDNFSNDYLITFYFYEYMVQLKVDSINTGVKPDLSRNALFGKMQSLYLLHLPGMNPEESKIKAYQTLREVLTSMACGPDVSRIQNNTSGESKSLEFLNSIFGTQELNVMQTPFGSSARFNGASIIKHQKINPCFFENRDVYMPPFFKISTDESQNPEPFDEIFNTHWRTGNQGEYYNSLAELIFDRIDPSIWQGANSSNHFYKWWETLVKEPIQKIWVYYENTYLDMYYDQFAPNFLKVGEEDIKNPSGVLDSLAKQAKQISNPLNQILKKLKSNHVGDKQLEKISQEVENLIKNLELNRENTKILNEQKNDREKFKMHMDTLAALKIEIPNSLSLIGSLIQVQDISLLSEEDVLNALQIHGVTFETLAQIEFLYAFLGALQATLLELHDYTQLSTMMGFQADTAKIQVIPLKQNQNPFLSTP